MLDFKRSEQRILDYFGQQWYQTLINDALNSYLGVTAKPLTEDVVRKIVREELSGQS